MPEEVDSLVRWRGASRSVTSALVEYSVGAVSNRFFKAPAGTGSIITPRPMAASCYSISRVAASMMAIRVDSAT
jgi:hypothetical protein